MHYNSNLEIVNTEKIMYLQEIPDGIYTTTIVKIKYDCEGGFERCGKEWSLKYVDAKKNFEKNNGKHICRKCLLTFNNPASTPEAREKARQTCLEKHGATCAMNSKENIAKRNRNEAEIVEKRRQTFLEKYGVEHHMKTEKGKQAVKDAYLKKYGVDHPMKLKSQQRKARKTVYDKYGVTNVMHVPEFRKRMLKTTLERHGVEHYNKLPEMKDYLRENCKVWLKESWESGGPNKGIKRPEEWNQKQSNTMTEKILNGELNPEDPRFYVTGYFMSKKCKKQPAFFRSSLELMMNYILHNDDDCEWYENEPFKIPYEKSEGVIRNYIPDFIVGRKKNKIIAYRDKTSI